MKKAICITACLSTLMGCMSLTFADTSPWKTIYDEAQENFRKGRIELAIVLANKALSQAVTESGDTSLGVLKSTKLLGDLCSESGNSSEAIVSYKKALELHQKIFGDIHPNTVILVRVAASQELTEANMPAVRELLTRVLEIDELAGHSEDPCSSDCLAQCLIALSGGGNFTECLDTKLAEKR